jgi:hypothetical protein
VPEAKLFRQLITSATLAILGVFGGVHRLRASALARNFVPSNAT